MTSILAPPYDMEMISQGPCPPSVKQEEHHQAQRMTQYKLSVGSRLQTGVNIPYVHILQYQSSLSVLGWIRRCCVPQ